MIDLVNKKVIFERIIRDQTQQEKDDEANGFFNRLTQQDKASAAILLTMRDLIMQAFNVTQTQANNQLRTTLPDHFPDTAAFGHGDARMPFRGLHPEPNLNARDEFRGQCNLWQ